MIVVYKVLNLPLIMKSEIKCYKKFIKERKIVNISALKFFKLICSVDVF